jgi:hypothetical protein
MAINFPTSLDNFTNPTSGNTLDSPSHSQQHSDANDALEALEAKLGVGASPAASATANQVLNISSAGTSAWTSTLNNLVLVSPEESFVSTATAAGGTVTVDVATSGITYSTGTSTSNFIINLQANSTATLSSILNVGNSITHTYMATNGTGAFGGTAVRIDGTAVTTLWQGGSAPTGGNASSVDAYTITVFKTATTPTYVVFGSQTQFKS